MFCPKCGYEAVETGKFCARCGYALDAQQVVQPPAAGASPPQPPQPPAYAAPQPQSQPPAPAAPLPQPPQTPAYATPSRPPQPAYPQYGAYPPPFAHQYTAQPPKNKKLKIALIITAGVVLIALAVVLIFFVFGKGINNAGGGWTESSSGGRGERSMEEDSDRASNSRLVGSWSLSRCAFSFEDTGVGGFEGSFSIDEEAQLESSNILVFERSGDFSAGFRLVDPYIFAGESLDLTQYNRWRFIEDETPASGSVQSGKLVFEPSVEGFGYTVLLSDDGKLTLIITEIFVAESYTTPEGYVTVGGEVPMTYTLTFVPTPDSAPTPGQEPESTGGVRFEPFGRAVPDEYIGYWEGSSGDIHLSFKIEADGSGVYIFEQNSYYESFDFVLDVGTETFTVIIPGNNTLGIDRTEGNYAFSGGFLTLFVRTYYLDGGTSEFSVQCEKR